VKRFFLGLQREDLVGKTPLQIVVMYAMRQEQAISGIFLMAALLCFGGGIWGVFWHGDVIRYVLPLVGLVISFYALVATRIALVMPVSQMQQAQEQIRETNRLSSAIERLCAEMVRERTRKAPGLGRLAKARRA
jgi:fatty acid desaturase